MIGCFDETRRDREGQPLGLAGLVFDHPESAITWQGKDFLLCFENGPELGRVQRHCDQRGNLLGRLVVLGYAYLPGQPLSAGDLIEDWRRRGARAFDRIEGSFALCLHDAVRQRLAIVTDMFATRPVWTARDDGRLLVGSDVAHLAALLTDPPKLDPAYLWSFLSHACTVGLHGPFERVQALPAATVLTCCGRGRTTIERYAERMFEPEQATQTALADRLIDELRDAAASLVRNAERPALFLSGGLDSRLMAAACPAGVTAVTLCDGPNRETALARRIAAACRMPHRLIVRPPDWYPSLVEEASRRSCGLWAWPEAHYLPLSRPDRTFDHDVSLLGFGCDTFFKGNRLAWAPLWNHPPVTGRTDRLDLLKRLIHDSPTVSTNAALLLREPLRQQARDAYCNAVDAVLHDLVDASCLIPDVWELFWSGNFARIRECLNLVCLRHFTSERNLLSSARFARIYFSMHPRQRLEGAVVRLALERIGRGLAWIPDANSWLPPRWPAPLHRGAVAARRTLARARAWWRRRRATSDYRSHGSWPHFASLWMAHKDLRSLAQHMSEPGGPLSDETFDLDRLKRLWQQHQAGKADHQQVLSTLSTLAGFFEHVAALRRAIGQCKPR